MGAAPPALDVVPCAFGVDPADLDVDLYANDRAGVVTAVLERCARDGDGGSLAPEAAWALPVGARMLALVLIAGMSGRQSLAWSLTCPAPDCDEEVEIELPLAAFAASAAEAAAAEPAELTWHGSAFRPRRPTGEDLRRWRNDPPSDTDILADLGGPRFGRSDPPPELIAAVEEALAAVDPLVDVTVRSACPACGQALEVPVDLEGEALALVGRSQEGLLREVAALARAFGWSESEIVALPAQRRRRYLALLDGMEA